MEILSAALTSGQESAEFTLSSLSPLGLVNDKPCTVLVKNTAPGGPTWAVLYQAGIQDARVVFPTGPTIKVKAGPDGARVLLTQRDW